VNLRSDARERRLAAQVGGGLVLAVVAMFVPAGPVVTDEPPVLIRQDVTGIGFPNPCTGEGITITGGSLQWVSHVTEDQHGGLHVSIRGNAQGVVAEGEATGAMYRLAGDFWAEWNIRPGGLPFTTTVVEVHNVISSGPSDNVVVHILWHLTVGADGEVTAAVDSFRGECRG
jgi:hypothetical protein